ncbi:MAG TPA: alpha/beta hydrolase, partial [Gammaproteobacteria bacterium]|nr:alpha/beta hydrolase [Gammaproteobacteria bacterium]
MSTAIPSVVVVHGLWMPGTETLLMRRRLEAAGFATRLFRYRSVAHGLRANALRLAEFLAGLRDETVHLVGHSLGGVLILETLAGHPVACSGRVVCLGSPLTGSRTAAVLAGLPGGRWFIGKSMRDLLDRRGLAAC